MSKIYLTLDNKDKLVLINSETKQAYKEITNINGDLKIKTINKENNKYLSICEVDKNTLSCIVFLESFINYSVGQEIPTNIQKSFNELLDFMYKKIEDKNCISSEKIINEKYFKVTTYQL